MNILELKHAKKSFDGVEVLKDIDLSVSEGQVVSIIGPSGFRQIHPASLCDFSGDAGRR